MSDGVDYPKLLTEMVQKQIVILGPDIALLKARNVKSLEIQNDGTVAKIDGDPKEALQKLIDEYVGLSGLIVKKTMEPLLQKYSGLESVVNAVNGVARAATESEETK